MKVEYIDNQPKQIVKVGDLLLIEGEFYMIRSNVQYHNTYDIANMNGSTCWKSNITWPQILDRAKKYPHFSKEEFKMKVEKK